VGFGVKTAARAAEIAKVADAVVVGSAIVDALDKDGVEAAVSLCGELARATHAARD
jgi:tryptophan synthase alpha chain